MKGMLSIFFLSVVTAVIFMSGGYGHWEKDVTVEGTITVVVPEPESDEGTYVDSVVSTVNDQSDSGKAEDPSAKESKSKESNSKHSGDKEQNGKEANNNN